MQKMKHINKIFYIVSLVILIVMGIISCKTFILFVSITSLLMYLHLTVTTLSNALVARDFDSKGDLFWKLLFMTISAIGFSIYFTF